MISIAVIVIIFIKLMVKIIWYGHNETRFKRFFIFAHIIHTSYDLIIVYMRKYRALMMECTYITAKTKSNSKITSNYQT